MKPTAADALALHDAYPGLRWIIIATGIGYAGIPCMSARTGRQVLACVLTADKLEELRAMLPRGLVRSERLPADADLVVEMWL